MPIDRIRNIYHSSREEHKNLSMDVQWMDSKTITIDFNRMIYNDEKIKIVIGGLLDSHGRIVKEDIVIEYD